MKKGLDRCFLQYGIRMEDMQIIEQLCRDNDIEPEWFKENILKAYQEERSKESHVDDKVLRKLLNKAVKNI